MERAGKCSFAWCPIPLAIGLRNRSRARRVSGITIRKHYRSEVTIQSYAGEIRQVLSTLLVNAMEATSAGGTISAHVREVGNEENAKMRGVRVSISDTGSGISAENLPRIFEPFFTTKGQQGTGLGLWVAQGIVSRLGGTIRVRSSVRPHEGGTVVSVFLPYKLPGKA